LIWIHLSDVVIVLGEREHREIMPMAATKVAQNHTQSVASASLSGFPTEEVGYDVL
jgi:hypothetical protein